MLAHGPPFSFFLQNYQKAKSNNESHPYIQLFKNLAANVYEKIMGLHIFINLPRKNYLMFNSIIDGDIRELPNLGAA